MHGSIGPLEPLTRISAVIAGTDEGAIIEVLTQRSNAQRQQILKAYKAHYGRVLLASPTLIHCSARVLPSSMSFPRCKKSCWGLPSCLPPTSTHFSLLLHWTVPAEGGGTPNIPLLLQDLLADLKSELSGSLAKLILGLMLTPAQYDAKQLRKAVEVGVRVMPLASTCTDSVGFAAWTG